MSLFIDVIEISCDIRVGTLKRQVDDVKETSSTPAITIESTFGPQTAMRLVLLENSEKKTLVLHLAAESAIAHERWLGLLRGRIVSDEGTEYGEWSALCSINMSSNHPTVLLPSIFLAIRG